MDPQDRRDPVLVAGSIDKLPFRAYRPPMAAVWRMRDGMIAVWDAAFNVWEEGGERRSPVM
jgi:hypothetical protein